MRCERARSLLELHLDGELDALTESELQAHLQACDECAAALQPITGLRAALREVQPFAAPATLRGDVLAALDRVDPAPLAEPRSPAAVLVRPRHAAWSWFGMGAAFACTALVSSLLTLHYLAVSPDDLVEQSLVSDHLRALASSHLTDVESSDRHTVKPWFNGKLSYSPPVRDLADQGFPLVGGRVEILQGQPIAALIYRRRLHTISVFVWPATRQTAGVSERESQGIRSVRWVSQGFNFRAVSDLADGELTAFAQELGRRTATE